MSGWATSTKLAHRGLAALVGAVAPRRCAGCDQPTAAEPICGRCLTELRRCPVPLPFSAPGVVVYAGFAYAGVITSLVHHGKYRDARSALTALAEIVATRLRSAAATTPDAVVPVPLGRRRQRDRGYNQAAILGAAIARVVERPLLDALHRTRETRPQVGHNEEWRRANLCGAFTWALDAPVPRHVWVVDDVFTTGATTASAVDALRLAGCRRADIAAAARVL